jgi:hypothetical protein
MLASLRTSPFLPLIAALYALAVVVPGVAQGQAVARAEEASFALCLAPAAVTADLALTPATGAASDVDTGASPAPPDAPQAPPPDHSHDATAPDIATTPAPALPRPI